ncbi:MAG: 2-oxoglutarate dehydrogenase complex dihydrolipoyllysine-residue succinyltransferase [Deltaproteobacteria bacterium]|nr:2-oxoglutarate dehydrogenase complex dihydrolipoyllysine-residue succinyltransferase [Deltaproteobacteria bacterium]
MVELKVPALGESITEAVIGKWLKNVGEHVEADEPVVDLETDKITMQIPAPQAGALTEQRFSEGDTVKVGDIVGRIDDSAKATAAAASAPAKAEPAAPAETPAADSAREVQEMPRLTMPSTPMANVPERGPDGRRLSPSERRDYREGVWSPPKSAASSPAPAAERAHAPREVTEQMSPLRKRIAERLVQAQHETASLTTFNEVDMTEVMNLRKRFKDDFLEEHGVKLGFMSFFVKATVAALKLFPGLNAEIREDSIVYKHHYDIGIAVGTPKGLVVPVLRNGDHRDFAGVEQGIIDLAAKARDAKLTLDDLVGATFTITNGGIYGSMMSTPLLNYPQTGILGMHNIVKRPMVVDDQIQVRPMMYVALTYDHRVVDGREAVQFLVAIKERIENPDRLLIGV